MYEGIRLIQYYLRETRSTLVQTSVNISIIFCPPFPRVGDHTFWLKIPHYTPAPRASLPVFWFTVMITVKNRPTPRCMSCHDPRCLGHLYHLFFVWHRFPTFYSTSDTHTNLVKMYEISTNLVKMYEYPMYCKMLGVGNGAILKKKNVCVYVKAW